MALVNYLSDPAYKTDIQPADPETIFVMRSGKIVKISSLENPVVDISVDYDIVTETELDSITDFLRDNRLNLIKIEGNDRKIYVCSFRNRSVQSKKIGGLNYRAKVVLRGTLPSPPDEILDMTLQNVPPTDPLQRVAWTKPQENGIDLDGYQLQHRNAEVEAWTEVDIAAGALSHDLTYAKGTTIKARIRPYVNASGGGRNYGPFNSVIELRAAGAAEDPDVTIFPFTAGMRVFRHGGETYGYPITSWSIRYRTNGGWTTIPNLSANLTTREITGLAAVEHTVQVQVNTAYGEGDWTDDILVTPVAVNTQPLGSAGNPINIADPEADATGLIDWSAMLRDGVDVDNATYFQFTVPAGQGGRARIILNSGVSTSGLFLQNEDASISENVPGAFGLDIADLNDGDVFVFRLWWHRAFQHRRDAFDTAEGTLNFDILLDEILPPGFCGAITYDWYAENSIRFTTSPPSDDGGSPIMHYVWELIRSTGGLLIVRHTQTSLGTTVDMVDVFDGLARGANVRYFGRVHAVNNDGQAGPTRNGGTLTDPYL